MSDKPTAPVRVLVVEDRPVQSKLFGKMLEVLGYESQTAGTAREAMTLMQGFKPHVVMMDIGLPDVDGYQLAEQIRKDVDFKAVPIVAVSGYGEDSDKDRSRLAGIDLHLVKPISIEDLKGALAKLGFAREQAAS